MSAHVFARHFPARAAISVMAAVTCLLFLVGGCSSSSSSSKPSPSSTAAAATLPGLGIPIPSCTPKPDSETGVTSSQITVGQIISVTPLLPGVLEPAYWGVQAYFNLVNAQGGICGRKLVIDYNNDNATPADDMYRTLIHQVFAFVGSDSLVMDPLNYQQDYPFNPLYQDKGQYVPDITPQNGTGGRNASPYEAGVVGSDSPSLLTLQQFQAVLSTAASSSHGACKTSGLLYVSGIPGNSSLGVAELYGAALKKLGQKVAYFGVGFTAAEPVYQSTVLAMEHDGVNCVFTSTADTQDASFVKAAASQGLWPQASCTGSKCLSAVWVVGAGYGPAFIQLAGADALGVQTAISFPPLTDPNNSALTYFKKALTSVPGAQPAYYSVLGFATAEMFVQALLPCDAAPTRSCLMTQLRQMKDFTAGGLVGGTTPFASTKVVCNNDCGFMVLKTAPGGVYDWKWPTACWVTVKVNNGPIVTSGSGPVDWYRQSPASGFSCGTPQVLLGTPAT